MMRFVVLCLIALLVGCQPSPQESKGLDLSEALGGIESADFERAVNPRVFHFPADHQAHPGFRNEWWYITGNLTDSRNERYGFQVTFFRIGIKSKAKTETDWDTSQLWMGHVALTDVQAQRHYQDHRLSRQAVGLAGQGLQPFKVWLEDWQIVGEPDGEFPWKIQVATNDFSLDLVVEPLKPHVLQGDAGLSQKGQAEGNASYYYSFPRLSVKGRLSVVGKEGGVEGLAWLDREWSTSVLDDDQEGWDWFSLQLEDGRDLMFYQLRNRGGGISRNSSGTLSLSSGEVKKLTMNDVALEPMTYWVSDAGGRYPVSWRMSSPELEEPLLVKALLDDQAMTGVVPYWEGTVKVTGEVSGKGLGFGYLEMTGYAE